MMFSRVLYSALVINPLSLNRSHEFGPDEIVLKRTVSSSGVPNNDGSGSMGHMQRHDRRMSQHASSLVTSCWYTVTVCL